MRRPNEIKTLEQVKEFFERNKIKKNISVGFDAFEDMMSVNASSHSMALIFGVNDHTMAKRKKIYRKLKPVIKPKERPTL